MGKLIDENVTIIQADHQTVKFAIDYIIECYPDPPDERHDALRKFQVDHRRDMIAAMFQELNELVWNGHMRGGIGYNSDWDPTNEEDS